MFTCGFFDSKDGDRKYNAKQMSAIFDGIIMDGVYSNIGEALMVVKGTGMQVVVQTGRAWFKHVWCLNDSHMPLEIAAADVIRTRIDAVVIEINHNLDVRNATIKVVKGNPATTASKPTMVHANDVDQYALAYVTVDPETTEITSDKIEIAVGKNETPFVQCPLRTVSIEDLFNQWNTEFDGFMAGRQSEFDEWFNNLKLQLTEDVVTNLQNQINDRPTFEYVGEHAYTPGKSHRIFFKRDGTFTVPSGVKDNKFLVICQGGGGAGFDSGIHNRGNGRNSGGGGGGYFRYSFIKSLKSGESVPITVGVGGKRYIDSNWIAGVDVSGVGGVSKFGDYVSANGGGTPNLTASYAYTPGHGGSGGGGGNGSPGGNGENFGGGGGGGGAVNQWQHRGGTGGNGGVYGGGGGGGQSNNYKNNDGVIDNTVYPASGGSGYTHGGSGGTQTARGGNGGDSNGLNTSLNIYNEMKIIARLIPELNLSLGNAKGGSAISYASKVTASGYYVCSGGGGAGPYGSGGNGKSIAEYYNSSSCGGGGGGGMFGDGGDASRPLNSDHAIGSSVTAGSGGGGGGGFNGAGGSGMLGVYGGGGGGLDIGDGYGAYQFDFFPDRKSPGGHGYGSGGGGYKVGNHYGFGADGIVIVAWEDEY